MVISAAHSIMAPPTTLGDAFHQPDQRRNNLDFIRVFAALLVVFQHSFVIAMGPQEGFYMDPLAQMTGGKLFLGRVGVIIFFVLSGFLISASYERSSDTLSYLKKRCLRIFPALICVILGTAFVLGPLVTTLEPAIYLTHPKTYAYLLNLTLLKWVDALPGVFENNPAAGLVNGSLWTIRYEFYCYLAVCLLGGFKLLSKGGTVALYVLVACLAATLQHPDFHALNTASGIGWVLREFSGLFLYFLAGMLFFQFKEHIRLHSGMAAVSACLLAIALLGGPAPEPVLALLAAYLIFYLAWAPWLPLGNFAKHGDVSYGLYIYAWPVQQLVTMALGPNVHWALVFLLTLPIVLTLAFLSWHGVEKRALRLKPAHSKPKGEVALAPLS